MELFNHKTFRAVLEWKLKSHSTERGYQSRLAQAIRTQPSTLSRVIQGGLDLTREQALDMARFWKFNPVETEYFLGLVDLERAGSPTLKTYIEENLDRVRERGKFMFQKPKSVSAEKLKDELKIATSWEIRAIHALMGSDKFHSRSDLANRLNLSEEEVERALQEMAGMGLIAQAKNGKWAIKIFNFTLSNEQAAQTARLIARHKATSSILSRNPNAFHTSGVVSMTAAQYEKYKREFMNLIYALNPKGEKPVDVETEEWDAYCVNVDLFRA